MAYRFLPALIFVAVFLFAAALLVFYFDNPIAALSLVIAAFLGALVAHFSFSQKASVSTDAPTQLNESQPLIVKNNSSTEVVPASALLEASHMLRAALDAFTSGDGAAARLVIDRDDEIDELYNHIFRDLIEMMVTDPTTTTRAARLLFVTKHIERIGDYVTDICELTVYMTEAAFIKHSN